MIVQPSGGNVNSVNVSNVSLPKQTPDVILYNNLSDTLLSDMATVGYDTSFITPSQAMATFGRFLSKFNITNPLPTSPEELFQEWQTFLQNGLKNTPAFPNSKTIPANQTATYKLFETLYAASQGIGTPDSSFQSLDPSSIAQGDWSIINQFMPLTPQFIEAQFSKGFTNFLTTYPYDPNTGGIFTKNPTDNNGFLSLVLNFVTNFSQFESPTALVQADSPNTLDGSLSGQDFSKITSTYESFYKVMFPNAPASQFQDKLKSFINSEIQKKGFFSPTQGFSEFVRSVQQDFVQSTSSVLVLDPEQAGVIDRILLLLTTITGELQKLGATQANLLNYFTKLQTLYTQKQQQITTVVAGGVIVGENDSKSAQARSDINTISNAQFQQTIQGLRDTAQSNAKNIQTSVNQTNDAVNSLSQMANSLLQQLSTLLQTIFRG